MTHTNDTKKSLAVLKRAYKGTFHKITPKHLDRYFTEFKGKHNICESGAHDQMARVASSVARKWPQYGDLTTENDLDNGARA